jgi:hypothetical protein
MGENVTVQLTGVAATAETGNVNTIVSMTFAPAWFNDALRETEANRDARRREIVFAVACAESYLFEWVRDSIVRGDLAALGKYFPPDRKLGVRDRWKAVIKELHDDGKIAAPQGFGGSIWSDFRTLVRHRDGVLHASASRPDVAGSPPHEKPTPTMRSFEEMKPGEAAGIVRALIFDLHNVTGTSPPDWLTSN